MTATMAPPNTGIGVGPNNPAPANLSNSAMASGPSGATAAIPFTRGSTPATADDASGSVNFSSQLQIQLQSNAFLRFLEIELTVTTAGNTAAVAFNADAPWNLIKQIQLVDPSGTQIMAPISGYNLYLLNKYAPWSGCLFDPKNDPNYEALTGTGATGGSISMRLIVPVEVRKRDAFGALNNSAANQRYLLTINTGATTDLYSTAPTTEPTSITYNVTQHYWTSPPAVIVSSAGQTAVQATPSGLGSVMFTRYERHNEVSGGGTPPIQLTSVGDYIAFIAFILRNSSNAREATDWPSEFKLLVNDFQTDSIPTNKWLRDMARFFGYQSAAAEAAGGLDTGVFVFTKLQGLFDKADNFGPASQYLSTNSTTKLMIAGSTWGSGASYLEVLVGTVKPNSGAALFA